MCNKSTKAPCLPVIGTNCTFLEIGPSTSIATAPLPPVPGQAGHPEGAWHLAPGSMGPGQMDPCAAYAPRPVAAAAPTSRAAGCGCGCGDRAGSCQLSCMPLCHGSGSPVSHLGSMPQPCALFPQRFSQSGSVCGFAQRGGVARSGAPWRPGRKEAAGEEGGTVGRCVIVMRYACMCMLYRCINLYAYACSCATCDVLSLTLCCSVCSSSVQCALNVQCAACCYRMCLC